MSHRNRALFAFSVALLVVVACGISLAHAPDAGADVCGSAKGWGPAKADTGSSTVPLLDLAAIPIAISGAPALAPDWAGFPDLRDRVAREVVAEPVAPRAPPIA